MTGADKAQALRLLRLYAECPRLIQTAPLTALRLMLAELDPQGDFDMLTVADVRAIVSEWAADEYHTLARG